MILVYTTFPKEEEASKVAKSLVQNKLAACVNLIPKIKSFYSWEGKLCEDDEIVLLIKSTKEKFTAVQEHIQSNHSYSCPAIFSIPIDEVENNYESWLLVGTNSLP